MLVAADNPDARGAGQTLGFNIPASASQKVVPRRNQRRGMGHPAAGRERKFVTHTADIAEKAKSHGLTSFASVRALGESAGVSAIRVVAA